MKVKALLIRNQDSKKLDSLAVEYRDYCGFAIIRRPGLLMVLPKSNDVKTGKGK